MFLKKGLAFITYALFSSASDVNNCCINGVSKNSSLVCLKNLGTLSPKKPYCLICRSVALNTLLPLLLILRSLF